MKRSPSFKLRMICLLLILLVPVSETLHSQTGKTVTDSFPVAQQLAREGSFAVRLLSSLTSAAIENETTAETKLGEMGIAPRNGWVADYPITPDIIGELRNSIARAIERGKLGIGKAAAVLRLNEVCSGFGLFIDLDRLDLTAESQDAQGHRQPDSAGIKNYFASMGPPVVTYYQPPAEYSGLYSRVPYPFRSNGTSFQGFYILKRFHRTIFENGKVMFVSNSYHVFRSHAIFLIDPVARFKGKTFAGIGAPSNRRFKKTGIHKSERKVFNGPQPWVRP